MSGLIPGFRALPRNVVLALSLVFAGGLFGGWRIYLRDQFIPKHWRTVVNGRLYASGQLSAALVKQTLEGNSIRVVVDLTELDAANPDQAAELWACDELRIAHYRYPMGGDGRGDVRTMGEAIVVVAEAIRHGMPVLVHCAAGAQRTGTVIAGYRLLIEGRAGPKVVRELFRHGGNRDLVPFLNSRMRSLAGHLVSRGALQCIPEPLPQLTVTETPNSFWVIAGLCLLATGGAATLSYRSVGSQYLVACETPLGMPVECQSHVAPAVDMPGAAG